MGTVISLPPQRANKNEIPLWRKLNSKKDNKYLSWAFTDAADFSRRYDAKPFINRKSAKTKRTVAYGELSYKLE